MSIRGGDAEHLLDHESRGLMICPAGFCLSRKGRCFIMDSVPSFHNWKWHNSTACLSSIWIINGLNGLTVYNPLYSISLLFLRKFRSSLHSWLVQHWAKLFEEEQISTHQQNHGHANTAHRQVRSKYIYTVPPQPPAAGYSILIDQC